MSSYVVIHENQAPSYVVVSQENQQTNVILQNQTIVVRNFTSFADKGDTGDTGPAGATGPQGPQNLFIQPSAPVYGGPYVWFDTTGGNISIKVEDGI